MSSWHCTGKCNGRIGWPLTCSMAALQSPSAALGVTAKSTMVVLSTYSERDFPVSSWKNSRYWLVSLGGGYGTSWSFQSEIVVAAACTSSPPHRNE